MQTAGNQTNGNGTEGGDEVDVHFELGAVIGGWQRSPTNPALNLQAGNRYRVTWVNLDGVDHDFTIRDAEANDILSTEIVDTRGATRSVTFTASEEMDHYVCTIHPETMVGAIQMDGEDQTDSNGTEGGDEVDVHFELGAVIGGWQGHSPFDGETNPTLDLQAGNRYRVTWENLDGVNHDFTIRDGDGSDILSTEIVDTRGATRSVTFTVSEEMDHYVCTIHPETMRGAIQIGGGGPGEPTTGPGATIGGMAVLTLGLVAAIFYVLSKHFDDQHEP